jgi:hypothetical protein
MYYNKKSFVLSQYFISFSIKPLLHGIYKVFNNNLDHQSVFENFIYLILLKLFFDDELIQSFFKKKFHLPMNSAEYLIVLFYYLQEDLSGELQLNEMDVLNKDDNGLLTWL